MKNLKKLGLPKNSKLLKDAEMKTIMGGWDDHYDDPLQCGADPILYNPPEPPDTSGCGDICTLPGLGSGTCEYVPFIDGNPPEIIFYQCICTGGV